MAASEKYEQLNEDIALWAKARSVAMREQVGRLTLKDKHALQKSLRLALKDPDYKPLKKSIGFNFKKDFAQIGRVNFRFARQGVFLEHGVGRGRKRNSANARPKPWLAPILDPALNELAELLAENYADIAVGEIKFFAPGILNRRIKINNG